MVKPFNQLDQLPPYMPADPPKEPKLVNQTEALPSYQPLEIK